MTTTTACLLALLAGVVGAPTRAVVQDLVFDQYQRWKPRPYAFDQPVRVVAVDDESLKQLGQWPWPRRERLAALVETLKNAGAATIVFDFLFAEKDRADVQRRPDRLRTTCSRARSTARPSSLAASSPTRLLGPRAPPRRAFETFGTTLPCPGLDRRSLPCLVIFQPRHPTHAAPSR